MCDLINLKLAPVSDEFIMRELASLNPCKSTGLDNIPSKFLKDGASVLTSPISYIVNLSISSSIVPT